MAGKGRIVPIIRERLAVMAVKGDAKLRLFQGTPGSRILRRIYRRLRKLREILLWLLAGGERGGAVQESDELQGDVGILIRPGH